MSSFESLEEIKRDLAQYMNIRTLENTKYKIEIVVGESGFVAGAREVVKKVIRDVHEMDRSDILILQIDDVDYKDEHTVVIVTNADGEKKVYKNITVDNTKTIFETVV